jgi:hypothetical protein
MSKSPSPIYGLDEESWSDQASNESDRNDLKLFQDKYGYDPSSTNSSPNSSPNSSINSQESPVTLPYRLKREVSIDAYNQQFSDCYGYAFARLLCKWIRVHNPQVFSEYDTLSKNKQLNNKFMDTSLFYNATNKKSTGSVENFNTVFITQPTKFDIISKLNPTLIHPEQYLNTCLFMIFYSKIVENFGCNGYNINLVFEYILSQIQTKRNIKKLLANCPIAPQYCSAVENILLNNLKSNMKPDMYGINPFERYAIHSVARRDLKKNPKIKSFFKKFYDIIRENIDRSNYVLFDCCELLFQCKSGNETHQVTYEELETKIRARGNRPILGHIVTIVDYNYDNPKNRKFIIKNSWGPDTPFMIIYENELLHANLYLFDNLLELLWIESGSKLRSKTKSLNNKRVKSKSKSKKVRHSM